MLTKLSLKYIKKIFLKDLSKNVALDKIFWLQLSSVFFLSVAHMQRRFGSIPFDLGRQRVLPEKCSFFRSFFFTLMSI